MLDVVARTVKQFCTAYGIRKTMAYELMAAGKLERRKVGTRTLITEASARQWFESLSTPPDPRPDPRVKPRLETEASEPRRKRQYHKSRMPKEKSANVRTVANGSGRQMTPNHSANAIIISVG